MSLVNRLDKADRKDLPAVLRNVIDEVESEKKEESTKLSNTQYSDHLQYATDYPRKAKLLQYNDHLQYSADY